MIEPLQGLSEYQPEDERFVRNLIDERNALRELAVLQDKLIGVMRIKQAPSAQLRSRIAAMLPLLREARRALNYDPGKNSKRKPRCRSK